MTTTPGLIRAYGDMRDGDLFTFEMATEYTAIIYLGIVSEEIELFRIPIEYVGDMMATLQSVVDESDNNKRAKWECDRMKEWSQTVSQTGVTND